MMMIALMEVGNIIDLHHKHTDDCLDRIRPILLQSANFYMFSIFRLHLHIWLHAQSKD